jgi:hypothetical protein
MDVELVLQIGAVVSVSHAGSQAAEESAHPLLLSFIDGRVCRGRPIEVNSSRYSMGLFHYR